MFPSDKSIFIYLFKPESVFLLTLFCAWTVLIRMPVADGALCIYFEEKSKSILGHWIIIFYIRINLLEEASCPSKAMNIRLT